MSCGISTSFPVLFPTRRQITHALLTRLPLYSGLPPFALDLHVLGTPPALILSQDQTLQLNSRPVRDARRRRFAAASSTEETLVLEAEPRFGMIARYLVFKEPPLLQGTRPEYRRAIWLSSPCDDSGYGGRLLGGYGWRDRHPLTAP